MPPPEIFGSGKSGSPCDRMHAENFSIWACALAWSAGLAVNASVEEVEQTQGLKLENGAQLMTIPGVDLAKLPPATRAEALQKLNSQPCTCGCDLTVAKCRVDDPSCGVSLPLARQIVAQLARSK